MGTIYECHTELPLSKLGLDRCRRKEERKKKTTQAAKSSSLQLRKRGHLGRKAPSPEKKRGGL